MFDDGLRVAIGEPADGNGQVRIFDWTGTSWVQAGGNLAGENLNDFFGKSVSLSADGSRVAIGASSGNGYVRVFDWTGTLWEQAGGTIVGYNLDDGLGRSVSLSADGSRVATGAPQDSSRNGYVLILDLIENLWVPAGVALSGLGAFDYFGFTVSLSADGSRVAIGGLYNNANGPDSGHVQIYDWSGTAWDQVGVDIVGANAGDQFGRSVSLSADGSRVAIGATYSNGTGGWGTVSIFEWNSGAWEQVGDTLSDAEAFDDFFGYYVSLSAEGSRVAIGAHHNDGGALTDSGQRMDRQLPLEETMVGRLEFFIGATLPPGTLLARVGDVVASLSGASTDPEVEINYEISTARTDNVRVTLYDFETCGIEVNDTIPPITLASNDIDSTTFPLDTDHSFYEILLDIVTESVYNSSVWTTAGATDTEGEIKFCIRTELMLEPNTVDEESVLFAETKITLSVSLMTSFEVNGITVQAVQDDLSSETATTSYAVDACHCDNNGDCHDPSEEVVANSILRICVEAPAGSEVVVDSVASMNLYQDVGSVDPDFIRAPIVDGTPDALTTSTVTEGGKAVIETQLTAIFFDSATPGDIVATGVVILEFANGARGLARITAPSNLREEDRDLQDAAVGEFDVSVPVQPIGQESGYTNMVPVIAGVVSGVAVLVMVAFVVIVRRRRRSKHQKDNMTDVSGTAAFHKEMTNSDGSSSDSLA